jgi:hypothetical protein
MSVSHNISAMTDISANIFALLILILLIMLAARENAPAPRIEGQQVIDLEKDLAGVERAPLSSEELIELLYERRERASSTKIDLLEQEIVISFGGKTERFGTTEIAVSRLRQSASVGSPVGVYVFSHRFYRDISDSLKTLGWSWREISIPQALRASAGGPQGWSAGFSELIAPGFKAAKRNFGRRMGASARSRHRRTNYNEKYQEDFEVKMLLLAIRPRGFVSLSCSNCLASCRKPRTRYAYFGFQRGVLHRHRFLAK